MIERNNPRIDVDDLMSRVQREVAKWRSGAAPQAAAYSSAPRDASVEALLAIAESKSQIRTRWSSRIDLALFRLPGLQRLSLRALAFLFKDQRHVNDALIAALRASLAEQRELAARVGALEGEVDRLRNAQSFPADDSP